MAVTLDQASIYTGAGAGQTNHTGTTTATVASGALIVILAHRFKSGGTGVYTGTGGGLSWATVHTVSSGNILIVLLAAFAPSGLASGTTGFGVNGSVTANDYTVCAASYLGVDSSGGVAGAVTAIGGSAATATAWATGAIGGNAGDLYTGGAGGDGTLQTSAATSGTERIDFNSATSSGSVTLVDKLSGTASDNLAGNWSPGSFAHVRIAAAFKAAGGGGGGTVVKQLSALGVG